MFESLASKTFIVVAASLASAYIGCALATAKMKRAVRQQTPEKIPTIFWTAMIIDIMAFIALMFLQNSAPLNAVFMAIFTLASGATLSIYFVANADVAQKALAITGAATLLTALIATYSDIDFTWLGNILFISLLVLIIVSIIGLFVKIKGAMQKFIAFCGVFIFTGYLLYDFSRLAKLKGVDAANNWNTALNFAVSIYLDIINLFIQLMNLLGNSN